MLNDHTLSVSGRETIRVSESRHDHIVKGLVLEVDGGKQERIGGAVAQDHETRKDVVQRNLDQRVGESRTTRIGGRDDLEIQGTAEERYAGDLTTRVGGNLTLIVGKHDKQRALTLRAEGTATFSGEDTVEVRSAKGVAIVCGKSSIRIGDDGIELSGPFIRIAGDKSDLEIGEKGLRMKSEKVSAELTERLFVKTDKAIFSMKDEIKLDGEKILLSSPDKSDEKPPPPKPPPTEFALVDEKGKALANQRFIIELLDGSQRTGITDAEGKTTLELPSGGTIRFPDLSEVSRV